MHLLSWWGAAIQRLVPGSRPCSGCELAEKRGVRALRDVAASSRPAPRLAAHSRAMPRKLLGAVAVAASLAAGGIAGTIVVPGLASADRDTTTVTTTDTGSALTPPGPRGPGPGGPGGARPPFPGPPRDRSAP